MKRPMLNRVKNSQKLPFRRRVLSLALATMVLSLPLSTNISLASPIDSGKITKAQVPATSDSMKSYTLSLKQLGAGYSIHLAGQDGRNTINFNVPADEVISQARLKIRYKYSPDLLNELSQINIYLNGESISTIEVSKENGNKDLETTVVIPTELFSENNQFTFQLIGHYASNCEDPSNPKLWADISNQSALTINSLPLKLPNNLANFPIPFTSKYNSRKLVLPFVFLSKPNKNTLEAAGILSSWFGSNTIQSGTQFPVSIGSIPNSGNAIIFIDPSESLPNITLPSITGPMVFITTNPKDPYGKLLFLMGRNSEDLKQASIALALGGQNFSGQVSVLNPVTQLPTRKPYDAPNWLSGNGPVKLSDLNSSTKQLGDESDSDKTKAPSYIQIPPALYSVNVKGIPLHLNYSYTDQFSNARTVLSVYYKSQFIKSFALPMQGEWTSKLSGPIKSLVNTLGIAKDTESLLTKESTVYIPKSLIYPKPSEVSSLNSDQANLGSFLGIDFEETPVKHAECLSQGDKDIPKATINPDSTIDISGMQHFIEMPNLAAFSNSGFPFSRLADLSETAIVLPENPNSNDYSAYLAVLGRIGRLTGYPGTSIIVTSVNQLDSVKNKDLIVITSGNESKPLLKQWEKNIPTNNRSIFKIPRSLEDLFNWFSTPPHFDIYQNTFIAGFKSPLESSRSVILISSINPDKLNDITASLDGSMGSVYGSLVRLNEGQVELIADDQTYHTGSLSWPNYLFWLISEYLALLMLISVIAAVMLSLLIYAGLKAKRRKRLQS